MPQLVRDIMVKKVITVGPFQSADYAIQKMLRYKVGGLPVIQNHKLIGIVTSRDLRDQSPNRLVCDVMTKEVVTGGEDMSILEALILIQERDIERLPIIKIIDKKLVGLITKGDILLKLNDNKFSLVAQLAEEAEDKILNPLHVISGIVQLLEKKSKSPKGENRPEHFKKIHNSIEKIQREVRMLRDFLG